MNAGDVDPLTLAIAPPPNETPAQRAERESAEAEALRISNEIDEQIRKERENERKKKRPVKLLLLGQSESGKTATLKNFQLTYAKREWIAERNNWRAVVFLNLVRNVNNILDILTREMAAASLPSPDYIGSSDESSEDINSSKPRLKFKEKHRLLKLRLGPLRRIQNDLERRFGATALEPQFTSVTTAAPFGSEEIESSRQTSKEFSINSRNGWKSAFEKIRATRAAARAGGDANALRRLQEIDDEIAEVIAGCREDMKAIWEDLTVREMLSRSKSRVEDSAGFFLNDVDRIAVSNYEPTDDDVVRARLRTLGVQEYKFIFEHGRTAGQEWRLYDVGGTRSSRAAWWPYFDDVNAIIFLAPISCFDEKLAEDRRVNRLEDSFLLWRSVCECKLLSRTQLILFLNKCDLLQAKLQRGIRIRSSVPSFGDRRNDISTATRYFQQHFKEILKQYSPAQRSFFVHLTSVIDTRSTAVTLGAVEESILRDHLRRADLM
ncbi:guanine nucleotide binding protein, alpha subunit [Lentinula aciculospora]|uniref:Guanine nucleotide binding protein, alpha subunit n=1 Tax=Lentinula aciculospora TaxID=153920 RepID=A0A9W9AFI1_9AGAR|nr:guanine nucleotide binding protein, alpha subunit [Lentinula aciculospora]